MKSAATALLAAGALLSGLAPGFAIVILPTYEEVFADLAVSLQDGRNSLPDMPTTPEDKKAVKAWESAQKAVDKANAKPGPAAYTKAAAKVEKTLGKAFPEDSTVFDVRNTLALAMIDATQGEIYDLENDIGLLPPGDDSDFLQGLMGDVQGILDLVSSAVSPADVHEICGKATKALGKVQKKYNKSLLKAAGAPGMSAVVGETPFTATFLEGTIVVDPAGKPKQLSLSGFKVNGLVSENVILGISLIDSEEFVAPGTYLVDGLGIEGGYVRTGLGGVEEIINGEAGTITLSTIDAVHGKASGIFTFSGPTLGGPTGTVTEGRFNATNLIVVDLD